MTRDKGGRVIEKELTVTRLDLSRLEAMHRSVNKMLMVEWINADLPNRASHDVRKSIVLYDDCGMFVSALKELPDDELLQQIGERTSVRFYSEGV
jgi:inosine/xanthosine triphosphate pyrophosphatase family protein